MATSDFASDANFEFDTGNSGSTTFVYPNPIPDSLSGALGLVVLGSGTLDLSGENSYTGGTLVVGATLQLGSSSALGASTGSLTVNGGILDLGSYAVTAGAVTVTGGGSIGDGSLVATSCSLSGDSALNLTGGSNVLALTLEYGSSVTGTYSASPETLVADDAGTDDVSGIAAGWNLTVTNCTTVNVSGDPSLAAVTASEDSAIAGAMNATSISVDASTVDLGGAACSLGAVAVADGGGLGDGVITATSCAVSGDSTVTLSSGSNSLVRSRSNSEVAITGDYSDSSATLVADDGSTNVLSSIPSNAGLWGLAVSNGTSVDLADGTDNFAAVALINGSISDGTIIDNVSYVVQQGTIGANLEGSAGLTMNGNSIVVLAGVNSYSGGTIVASGTLEAALPAALPGYLSNGVSVQNGATLAVALYAGLWPQSQIDLLTETSDFSSGSSLGVDTGSVACTYADTNLGPALGLAVLGSGTLGLTGTNTDYCGNITIAGPTLQVGSNACLGTSSATITFNGGTLQATSGVNVPDQIVLGQGGGVVDSNGCSVELDGQISGSGEMTVIDSSGGNGTVTVTCASNNYTGGTNLGSGTMAIGADGRWAT